MSETKLGNITRKDFLYTNLQLYTKCFSLCERIYVLIKVRLKGSGSFFIQWLGYRGHVDFINSLFNAGRLKLFSDRWSFVHSLQMSLVMTNILLKLSFWPCLWRILSLIRVKKTVFLAKLGKARWVQTRHHWHIHEPHQISCYFARMWIKLKKAWQFPAF